MGLNRGQPLSKLRISFPNFTNKSMVLISGLSLFHSSLTEGKKELLKTSVLQ